MPPTQFSLQQQVKYLTFVRAEANYIADQALKKMGDKLTHLPHEFTQPILDKAQPFLVETLIPELITNPGASYADILPQAHKHAERAVANAYPAYRALRDPKKEEQTYLEIGQELDVNPNKDFKNLQKARSYESGVRRKLTSTTRNSLYNFYLKILNIKNLNT